MNPNDFSVNYCKYIFNAKCCVPRIRPDLNYSRVPDRTTDFVFVEVRLAITLYYALNPWGTYLNISKKETQASVTSSVADPDDFCSDP